MNATQHGTEALNTIRKLLQTNGFTDPSTRAEVNVLWQVVCHTFNWEPDTNAYDNTLLKLWNKVSDDISFDDFDRFMCQGLC